MEYEVHGKGKSKSVAPDNLRSQDQMEVVLGLCEGEIEGFYSATGSYDGLDSLMLNDTSFRNLDGSMNFDDATVHLYQGTADQGPIQPVLGGLARSRSVGVSLAYNVPVTRTTMGGTDINYLDVRLVINALYDNDNYWEGNLTCSFRIEWKLTAFTRWTAKEVTVTGKTTSSAFVREVRIPVSPDETTNNRYDIRVTLLTQSSGNFVAQATWEGFQEVQRYPARSFENTAVLHFWCKASDQISSLPEISGIYKCMKVRVPANFDPISRTYTGVWDGSFTFAWTDDPAWCLYDLVMNDRYGLNAYGPITLNKWDAYRASKFCNRFVPAMMLSDDGLPVKTPAAALTQDATRFDFYSVIPIEWAGSDNWKTTWLISAAMRAYIVQFSEDGTNISYFSGTEKSVGYKVTFPTNGTYTLRFWADDTVYVYLDGTQAGSTSLDTTQTTGGQTDVAITVTAGEHILTFLVVNQSFASDPTTNPYALSGAIYQPDGNLLWNTRMTETVVKAPLCPDGWTYRNDRCEKTNPEEWVWEPRFTFNGLLSDARLSMEQVRYMAGAFHGVLYDDLDGTIRLCVPDAQPPTAVFNQSNVENGLFEYSLTDLTTRYNDWSITYTNSDLLWTEDRLRIFDPAHIAKYGRLATDFIAIACIYESEAIRRAYYRYQIATTQTKAVKFRTNRQGCWVRPYDRIRIADPHADGKQFGRVKEVSADRKTVTVFEPVDVTPATGFDFNAVVAVDYSALKNSSPIADEMNDIAVAMSDDGSESSYYTDAEKSVGYTLTLPADGTYVIRLWADDIITATLDGAQIGYTTLTVTATNGLGYTDATFTATAGSHTLKLAVLNGSLSTSPSTNPYAFAAKVLTAAGTELWNTRMTETVVAETGSYFIPQVPGSAETAYPITSNGKGLYTIGLQEALAGEFPEAYFPFNIVSEKPSKEKLWRVTAIYEDENSPDKLVIEAINDWCFDDHEENREDGGEDYSPGPALDGVASDGGGSSVETPPGMSCPDFSVDWSEDGRKIVIDPNGLDPSYTRYNGEYKVFSHLQGSSDAWVQRSTSANTILNHPAGAYEFKILPYNIYGVAADFSAAPTCNFSVPQCPPTEVLGTPQDVVVSVSWDGSGGRYAYLLDWTDGGVYVAGYQVVCRDIETGHPYHTADIETPYFRYTAAMQIQDGAPSDAKGFTFEVRFRDDCGNLGNATTVTATNGPDATNETYTSSQTIDYNCATLKNPVLRGYSEHVIDLGSTSGAVELNLQEGNVFIINLVGNVAITVNGGCGDGRPVTIIYTRPEGKHQATYATPVQWRGKQLPPITSELAMHLLFDVGGTVGWLGAEGGATFG